VATPLSIPSEMDEKEAAMPREARNEGKDGVLRTPASKSRTPKNRRESERKEQPRGGVVREAGGSGAPEGGQVDGRQGNQEGMRR